MYTYIWREEADLEIITVWVDDLMLFTTSKELMIRMKTDIKSEWEVTDLGELTKIVGIEITRQGDLITISQVRYIVRREGMLHVNPIATPLDPHIAIEPNPQGNKGSRSNAYTKVLGELQYLANAMRPDIAYAVNHLTSYTANLSLQHMGALKQILHYLAGTMTYGIMYLASPSKNRGTNLFEGYADTTYNNIDKCKSTSGYIFTIGGGAITWMSRKQNTTALSTTEAAYITLSEAGCKASWLRSLYSKLGFPQLALTIIHRDNEGSIVMVKNPQFHRKSKHIEHKLHWIQDAVESGIVAIESCRDQTRPWMH